MPPFVIHILPYVAAILFLIAVTGCGPRDTQDSPDRNLSGLREVLALLNSYSDSGKYSEFLHVAKPLYDSAVSAGDETRQVLFGTGVAEAYSRMDMPDSAQACLSRILPMALSLGNRDVLVMIYNTLGLYSIYYRANYNEAVDYFMKALEFTDTAGHGRDNYVRVINNLAHIHNLRSDTLGLRYSLEVYRAGHRFGVDYWTYIGAINTATQYCVRMDFSTALDYIREAASLTGKFHSTVEVYYVYAEVLAGLGRRREAEEYFRKAISMSDGVEAPVRCGLCRSYGDFLMEDGRWKEAADTYRRGIEIAGRGGSYMHLHELYLGLSEACGKMGDIRSELGNFKQYHYLSDSVFNVEKERAMNEMMVKFETEKKERLLHQREVELMEKNRRLELSLFIIVLLMVTVAAVTVLYLRRKEMYKQLVHRHYENYRLEQRLKSSSSEGETVIVPEEHTALGSDRLRQLYGEISSLMERDKVYRDSSLTVESLARTLQTNRTYISSAINQYAGMTFKSYVNSLRISEAVAILSDPNNDVPLKAMYDGLGFNSTSAFYRAFQNATGVPPSQYRKEARKMQERQIS